jgi:hypothetical protein
MIITTATSTTTMTATMTAMTTAIDGKHPRGFLFSNFISYYDNYYRHLDDHDDGRPHRTTGTMTVLTTTTGTAASTATAVTVAAAAAWP